MHVRNCRFSHRMNVVFSVGIIKVILREKALSWLDCVQHDMCTVTFRLKFFFFFLLGSSAIACSLLSAALAGLLLRLFPSPYYSIGHHQSTQTLHAQQQETKPNQLSSSSTFAGHTAHQRQNDPIGLQNKRNENIY